MYLKYLLLHPKQHSNDAIRGILEYAQLDWLGNWYLEKLRKGFKLPVPFRPFDATHQASSTFLYTERLHSIFFPDKHGKKAFELLQLPRVKEFVEAMLLISAPSQAVAQAVTRQHQYRCVPAVIDRYATFFWNMKLVDSTEMRALLQLRIDQLEAHPDPEVRSQAHAMKMASYKDARRVAAELPSSPLASVVVQTRMGVMPSKLDMVHALGQTAHVLLTRTMESVTRDGLNDSRKALDYSATWRNLVEISKELVHPEEDLRNQLAAIAMKTDDTPIPTIHDLSNGAHTAEVAKMETHDGQSAVPADLDDGDGSDDDPLEPG